MLQPLGITTEAEAVYLALGPLNSASVSELSRLTDLDGGRLDAALEQLRSLGLATGSSHGVWRALPLLDVVEQLRTQRLFELERSMAAAESLANHLLAQGSSQAEGVATVQGPRSRRGCARRTGQLGAARALRVRQAAVCPGAV